MQGLRGPRARGLQSVYGDGGPPKAVGVRPMHRQVAFRMPVLHFLSGALKVRAA